MNGKKLITVLFIACAVLQLGVSVYADEYYSLDGTQITEEKSKQSGGVKYDDDKCVSIVRGSVAMPDNIHIDVKDGTLVVGDFLGCYGIKSITLPDGVQRIAEAAFVHCQIENILLPDTVTDIGARAFEYSGLRQINLPYGITEIKEDTFHGCSLESIAFPDSVTDIGKYAFSSCHKLSTVKLSENIAKIGEEAFGDCISLTNITIPKSVTSIGRSAFKGCENLRDVYYEGSEYQWKQLSLNNDMEGLELINVHFAEENPQIEQKYSYPYESDMGFYNMYSNISKDSITEPERGWRGISERE